MKLWTSNIFLNNKLSTFPISPFSLYFKTCSGLQIKFLASLLNGSWTFSLKWIALSLNQLSKSNSLQMIKTFQWISWIILTLFFSFLLSFTLTLKNKFRCWYILIPLYSKLSSNFNLIEYQLYFELNLIWQNSKRLLVS